MKTFFIKLSPLFLLAALMFGTSAFASPTLDREPTTLEYLEGKVYRLTMELEEVRFKLKDRSISKLEKKKLKYQRRMLRRELSYNQDLLAHARFPGRFAYPGPFYPGYNYPIFLTRRPVVCPPSYRRPVVIVNRNNRSRNQGARTQAPRTRNVAPTTRSNRSSSSRVATPSRSRSVGNIQSGRSASPRTLKPIKP